MSWRALWTRVSLVRCRRRRCGRRRFSEDGGPVRRGGCAQGRGHGHVFAFFKPRCTTRWIPFFLKRRKIVNMGGTVRPLRIPGYCFSWRRSGLQGWDRNRIGGNESTGADYRYPQHCYGHEMGALFLLFSLSEACFIALLVSRRFIWAFGHVGITWHWS